MIFDIIFGENVEYLNISEVYRKSIIANTMIVPTKEEFINFQNAEGLTAIHFAAFWGNNDTIEYLIERGGDVFLKDKFGHNIIHIAT